MKIGTQVVCNRPNQHGNGLVDGILMSKTDRGFWVLVGQVEHWFPRWAVVEDRATDAFPAKRAYFCPRTSLDSREQFCA